MTDFSGLVQRVCKCACNKVFAPPASRPLQSYIHGHKPRTGAALGKLAAPSKAETPTLDYKLALRTANAEIASVTRDMDALDDKIVPLQRQLSDLEAAKEKLLGRHATLSETAFALQATIDGRDLRAELQEAI